MKADTAAFSLNREGHYTPLDGRKAHKYPYSQVVSSIGGGLQSTTDIRTPTICPNFRISRFVSKEKAAYYWHSLWIALTKGKPYY